MKNIKLVVTAVIVMAAMSVSGQTWNTNGDHIYNLNSGNVGIGIETPSSLIHARKFMTEPSIIIHNAGSNGGATFQMIDDLYDGNWKFKAITFGGFKIRDQASSLDVITIEKNSIADALYIKEGGNIGIGTRNPTSALTVNGIIKSDGQEVNGKISCKEVEVTIDGWPDYVFENNYNLRPLSDVEIFINENKHLPGVPSQKEIIENGLSLGEMNKVLIEKVEELTLYLIELQKQVDLLKENE